jgi:hypothetical protein
MPKDPGVKANRLAELRKSWYERPTQAQKPAAKPTTAGDNDVAVTSNQLSEATDMETTAAKKGRRSKKPAAEPTPAIEPTPIEAAIAEQQDQE